MTLLIGKQCTDGILLIADSVAIPDVGVVLCNGIKALRGVRNAEPYAAVLGGYAGNLGEVQTIDVLQQAINGPGNPLQDVIRSAMRARLQDEADNGDWQDPVTGVVDNVKRELFRNGQDIAVLVSACPTKLWVIRLTAVADRNYQAIAPYFMAITQPGADAAAYAQLQAACNHLPQTVAQAVRSAAVVFEMASVLFPFGCCYPAAVLRHTAAGVSEASFGDFAGLNNSGAP